MNGVRTMVNQYKASLMPVSKSIFWFLAILQLISILYSPLYYYLANIPYFITVEYYEVYRVFTSLFVERFSISYIVSLFMFPYAASRIEKRDGSIYLVYRIILLSVLSNTFFTLICWPILSWNPLLGFGLTMSGMSNLWVIFLVIDMIQDPLIRQAVASNRFFIVLAILLCISLLFSVSSIPVVLIALLFNFIPAIYKPSKRVAAFFIPFPVFKRLQARDKEEETKRVMEEQTARRFANFETIDQIRGEQIGQQSLLPGETTQTSQFKKENTQTSRFKGTGHTLGSVSI